MKGERVEGSEEESETTGREACVGEGDSGKTGSAVLRLESWARIRAFLMPWGISASGAELERFLKGENSQLASSYSRPSRSSKSPSNSSSPSSPAKLRAEKSSVGRTSSEICSSKPGGG